MVPLESLVCPWALSEAMDEGYVRAQVHPDLPLTILNYTQKAQFENAWTPATTVCRGIIHNADGMVVARPFRKFFNHGQPGAAPIALDAPVHVTDKADGSLAILYPTPDGHAIATRGSFTSDQAIHATDLFRREYASRFSPHPALTILFEVVYPENRVVVNYGDMDDLILIGAVERATGRVVPPEEIPDWPGPRVATFSTPTFADALALPPRENAEGIVVRCLKTGGMVKIKQADYLALHRIVTGLSAGYSRTRASTWELSAARGAGSEVERPPGARSILTQREKKATVKPNVIAHRLSVLWRSALPGVLSLGMMAPPARFHWDALYHLGCRGFLDPRFNQSSSAPTGWPC